MQCYVHDSVLRLCPHIPEFGCVNLCSSHLAVNVLTSQRRLCLPGSVSARVGADVRMLYAVGELNDYELLKKEIAESHFLVQGMQVRVQERMRTHKHQAAGGNSSHTQVCLCTDMYAHHLYYRCMHLYILCGLCNFVHRVGGVIVPGLWSLLVRYVFKLVARSLFRITDTCTCS